MAMSEHPMFPFAAMILQAAEKAKQFGSGHMTCSLITSHQQIDVLAVQPMAGDDVSFVYRVDGIRVEEDEVTRLLHNWEG